MSMTTVGARDVVVDAQGLTDSHCHTFFAAVEMRESGHQGAGIHLIHLLFKEADAHHLAIGMEPFLFFCGGVAGGLGLGGSRRHIFLPPFVTGVATPDIAASTSNMHAKSYFVQPMPRAAVRISLLTAVDGRGTSSCRPRSIARTISFCIMFTSNQASSGCRRTNGPRYWIMGDATAL